MMNPLAKTVVQNENSIYWIIEGVAEVSWSRFGLSIGDQYVVVYGTSTGHRDLEGIPGWLKDCPAAKITHYSSKEEALEQKLPATLFGTDKVVSWKVRMVGEEIVRRYDRYDCDEAEKIIQEHK